MLRQGATTRDGLEEYHLVDIVAVVGKVVMGMYADCWLVIAGFVGVECGVASIPCRKFSPSKILDAKPSAGTWVDKEGTYIDQAPKRSWLRLACTLVLGLVCYRSQNSFCLRESVT